MRWIIFFITLPIAFFLEWFLGDIIAPWDVPPPLAIATVLLFMWRANPSSRPWYALYGGIIIDTLSPGPFGVITLLLFFILLVITLFQKALSVAPSSLMEALALGMLLFIFLILRHPVALLFTMFRAIPQDELTLTFLGKITAAAALWGGIFTFLYSSLVLRRKLK